MRRNPGKGFAVFRELPDIADENMLAILAEILPIGFGGIFVPLAGEHAFAAYVFEADPQPADAREQVDETESCVFHGFWLASAIISSMSMTSFAGAFSPDSYL